MITALKSFMNSYVLTQEGSIMALHNDPLLGPNLHINPVSGVKALINSIPVSISSDQYHSPSPLLNSSGEIMVSLRLSNDGEGPSLDSMVPYDSDRDFIPASPVELVRNTPGDLVLHTHMMLHKGVRRAGKIRPIFPLPEDLTWIVGAELKTDILYTFIRDVVHSELERFVARLILYYELVPKASGKLEHG